ncbi:MAG: TetR/AcrR family transcriptional regulator [Actinobacteria bacterium]|nr:TetR/AcrR family transcriptional regulator [Actinomycetota bacterium]
MDSEAEHTEPGRPSRGVGIRPAEPPMEDRSTRKRRIVLEAATTLFLRHGYLGTSMDEIAADAGVSKPTVYKFFADKEHLFSEIVLGTLDRAAGPLQAEIEGLAETADLDGELPRLARLYLATVMQPQVLQLRRLVIGASHRLPALAKEYYERAPERTIRALAESFARLAERGLLVITDPAASAAQFAFLVLGRALDKSLFCGDKPFSDAELTAQADAGAAAFLAAYAGASG